MNRILMSLGMIVVAGAIVAGGTGAFFVDEEVSQGNIFTAGELDLTIDHTFASYNGDPCTLGECEPWADVSVSFSQGLKKNGSPVDLNRSNPDFALGAAETAGTPYDNPAVVGTFVSLGFGGQIVYEFIDPIVNGAGADLRIYEVTGGSSYPDETATVEVSVDGITWFPTVPSTITRDMDVDLGSTTEAYFVRITDTTNPALHNATADGFDLDAIEVIHCEGSSQYPGGDFCSVWDATDLTDETFWNFADIKPADWGRNVLSYHIEDNDAWTCLFIHDGDDQENTNIEPEQADGDTSIPEGELSSILEVFVWIDLDQDGDYDPADGEEALYKSPFAPFVSLPLHDSTTANGFQIGGTTEYIGLSWCAGDQTVNHLTGDIDCDGSLVDNTAQTDSFTASVTAYAEQVRNDETFQCNEALDALFLNP